MAKGQVRKKKIWMRQRDKRCNGMPNHGSVAAVAGSIAWLSGLTVAQQAVNMFCTVTAGPGRPQARVATISITTEYQFNTNIHFYSMRRNLKILDFSWKRNKLVVLQRADKGGPRCSWSHFLAADE